MVDDERIEVRHRNGSPTVSTKGSIRLVNGLLEPSHQLTPYITAVILLFAFEDAFLLVCSAERVSRLCLGVDAHVTLPNFDLVSSDFGVVSRSEVSFDLRHKHQAIAKRFDVHGCRLQSTKDLRDVKENLPDRIIESFKVCVIFLSWAD